MLLNETNKLEIRWIILLEVIEVVIYIDVALSVVCA